ncbi:Lupeol synthase [Vigna angularis]|uniref:Lupeol synthase n=1 Tax=Phaseolus angularis TaxID=3914 RepID=A0A8T0JY39_PHAAN|nr:Lupeol synthase [Vigna angularis]
MWGDSSGSEGSDGHWPAESAGPLFFLQPLVMALYITGSLDVVLGAEHKKEIVRYLQKALQIAIEHVRYEDENSRYLCIGSVEKVLCLLARWVEDPNSEAYKLHLARIPDYFWLAEDGLKIQSFGSQMWDAAFAIQAILSCDAALLLSEMPTDLVGDQMETQRFFDAVNVILSLQSSNGGFPAWEPQRAYRWLEKFNPTEFFEDTLIETE